MSIPPERPEGRTLETLLRLKRAERPDADFWRDFEQGLREKQLAAIVEPKPWWLGLSLLCGKLLPSAPTLLGASAVAGAAVALALGLPGLRTDPGIVAASARNSPPLATASATTANQDHTSADQPTVSPFTASSLESGEFVGRPDGFRALGEIHTPGHLAIPSSAEDVSLADGTTPSSRTNTTLRLVGLPRPESDTRAQEPLRSAFTAWPDPAFATLGGSPESAADLAFALPALFETNEASAPANDAAAASADDAAGFNPRHARLLATALPTADTARSSQQTRERVVRRLAEIEELYASAARVGVSGDRLSLRF